MFNESNQAKLLDHSQRQGMSFLSFLFLSANDVDLDQEVVEKLAEVDMIVADLERANSRVAALERRNVRALPVCGRSLAHLVVLPLGNASCRS